MSGNWLQKDYPDAVDLPAARASYAPAIGGLWLA